MHIYILSDSQKLERYLRKQGAVHFFSNAEDSLIYIVNRELQKPNWALDSVCFY